MNGRRTVVVIGGAGAIGTAIAELHAAQGDRVVVADLRGANEVAASLTGAGHTSTDFDVTDLGATIALLGPDSDPYDAVVYAAGTNYTGFVETTDWAAYDRLMNVNLRGAFYSGQALAQKLSAMPRRLSAVFLSSTAGLRGEGGGSIYCATKFGLIGFVQSLAAEIASSGGRANAVAPGNVDSPLLNNLAIEVAVREGVTAADKLAEWGAVSGFDRLITTQEVAAACAYLTSDAATGISGQTVVVDGPPR